jgi:RNA polymerase sigma factor (sigma-70 family)
MSRREPLPTVGLSDAVVISKIAAGDLESLGVLFDRYEPDVRRLLVYLSSRSADVDDLVQLTFLQVIRAAPNYDPQFAVRSWLTGIAAMMARRHRRSLKRMTSRLGTWIHAAATEEPTMPDEEVGSREMEERMREALARMSPKRREAFVLVAIEGTSGEDAAVALGIPLNTLWTRLHYARRDLRAELIVEDR